MTLLSDLESAPAGTRELSDRVLVVLGWVRDSVGQIDPASGRADDYVRWTAPDGLIYTDHARPSPAESIDDVIAECRRRGLRWHVGEFGDQPSKPPFAAWVDQGKTVYAATPALALSAALCRAVAQVKP